MHFRNGKGMNNVKKEIESLTKIIDWLKRASSKRDITREEALKLSNLLSNIKKGLETKSDQLPELGDLESGFPKYPEENLLTNPKARQQESHIHEGARATGRLIEPSTPGDIRVVQEERGVQEEPEKLTWIDKWRMYSPLTKLIIVIVIAVAIYYSVIYDGGLDLLNRLNDGTS